MKTRSCLSSCEANESAAASWQAAKTIVRSPWSCGAAYLIRQPCCLTKARTSPGSDQSSSGTVRQPSFRYFSIHSTSSGWRRMKVTSWTSPAGRSWPSMLSSWISRRPARSLISNQATPMSGCRAFFTCSTSQPRSAFTVWVWPERLAIRSMTSPFCCLAAAGPVVQLGPASSEAIPCVRSEQPMPETDSVRPQLRCSLAVVVGAMAATRTTSKPPVP
mmetsp:Transcript_101518/g.287629  ORF Transcript_101518/g.287629 Transcript_101518/m.287629 type:complete len:218 (-) Transcript_101518:19-672(-)